ncbi:MAG: polyprenyl synthetase family protein [Tepidanaerobacteraceae bacterium]|nr:polyprenyl synthetase family protein [Tepidanaerobacteraceae bacterium]
MLKQILGEIEEELLSLEEDLKRAVNTRIKLIKKPVEHMINSGGKRLRPAMVLASARFGEYDFEKIKPLAVSVELIHTATLIHDDIIDDSPIRRGIPSIQSQLGKDVAVFTGDYIFCKVFDILTSSDYFNMLQSVSKVMYQICEGELQQREDQFNTDLTLKNYLYRIRKKTALLFALSSQMGARASKASDEVVKALYGYGINIGIAFQIIDDLLDVKSCEKRLGKPVGADIREGVITLPSIYALKYSDERVDLKGILQSRHANEDEINMALKIIRKSGGVEYAEYLAKRYIQKAQQSIVTLQETPIKKVLSDLSTFVYNRCK